MKITPTYLRILSSGAAALVASLMTQVPSSYAGTFDYVTGTYTENFDLLGVDGLTTATLTGLPNSGSSPWTIQNAGAVGAGNIPTAAVATNQAVVLSAGDVAVTGTIKMFNNGTAFAVDPVAAMDRALGTGNTGGDPMIDLSARNMSGRALAGVTLSWDTEWWRGGTSATTNDFGYDLYYSPSGASGTWVRMGSPIVSIATAANVQLDGNLPANRTTSSVTYGFSSEVGAGGSMFFRWFDPNDPTDGPDANIALDNLQFTAFANIFYNVNHTAGGAPNGSIAVGGGNYFLSSGTPTAFQNGDAITFSQDTASATIDVPADVNVPQLTFTHLTGTYTVGGAGKITGALVKSSSGNVVLTGQNTFDYTTIGSGGQVTIQAPTTLARAGALTVGNGGVTLQLDADASVINGLNGLGQLTKTGPGTLTLTGTVAGNATGGVNLQGGKISLGTSSAIGATTQVVNITNNATLEWNVGADSNPSPRVINVGAGGATLGAANAAQNIATIFSTANSINGSEQITKVGPGVLRFTTVAQGTLSSPWLVNGGALEAQVNGGLGTGDITVNPTGLVVVYGANTPIVIANNITLAGGGLGVRSGNLGTFGTTATTLNVTADSLLSTRSNSTPANGQTYFIASKVIGSGALSIIGSTTGAGTGGVIFTNPANTYSGAISVGARQLLTAQSTTGTDDVLGTASIVLQGGGLSILDNGAGNNGTISYAHNLSIQAPSDTNFPSTTTINVNRQSGENTGNKIQFGNLIVDATPVTFTSGNGYAVAFGATTATDSVTINSASTAITFGPITGGAISFTKTGAGTLTLTGANTYTGPTTSDTGILNVNGSLAGDLVANAASTVNVPAASSIAGNVGITNTAFNLAGMIGGSLAATVNTSVAGTTTIAGTGTVVGALTVGNGVVLNPGDASHHGVFNAGDTTFGTFAGDNETINFNVDTVGANQSSVAVGALSVALGSTVTLNLLNALPAVGIYSIVDYSQGAEIDADTFNSFILAPIANPRITAALQHNTLSQIIELNVSTVDAPRWTGLGNQVWSTAVQTPKNWNLVVGTGTTDFMPGDAALFDNSAANKSVHVSEEDVAPSSVTFNNSGAGNNYSIDGNFQITGSGTLIKNGTGEVTISNSNSFTGGVFLNQGTVNITTLSTTGTNSALGQGGTITFGGGALNFTGFDGLTDRAMVVNAPGGTFSQNGSGDVTFAGTISGDGVLTKTGPGKLILTGIDSTFGGLTIATGIVQIGDGTGSAGAPGSGPLVIDGALVFNHANNFTANNTISGAGPLTKEGAGELTLGGTVTNTNTGLTTVTAGTLIAGKPAGTNAIGGDLLVQAGAAFRYAGNNVSNQLPDTATVTLDGGTFGDPTNAAPTSPGATDTIANLIIQNDGKFGSGRNILVTPPALFTITGTTTVTKGLALAQRGGGFASNALIIEPEGLVQMDGGSTTTSNGTTQESRVNVGAGGLTLHSGRIQFNSGPSAIGATSKGSILTIEGDVTSTGPSEFTRLDTTTPALKAQVDLGTAVRTFNVTDDLRIGSTAANSGIVVLGAGGGINKTGPGTLHFSATNTYTGGTTITEGTIHYQDAAVASAGNIALAGGGLQFDNATAFTNAAAISGNGTVLKMGGGDLTIGGTVASTYTGLTTIAAGRVLSARTNGQNSIGGDLLIQTGATFLYNGGTVKDQLSDTANVIVEGTLGEPGVARPGTGSTDTIGSLTVHGGGSAGSGRNTIGLVKNAYTVTGLMTIDANGDAIAQRGGGFSAGELQVAGTLRLDGGSTSNGEESFVTVGAGGLKLTGGTVSLNSAIPTTDLATNSKGSIVFLNGDVTTTGQSRFVNQLNNPTLIVGPRAEVDLGGASRTFNVTNSGDQLLVGTPTNPVSLVNGGIVKTGEGELNLGGANTYAGVTDIQSGILTVEGSISGSPQINVHAGATLNVSLLSAGFVVGSSQILSGSGTVAGAVFVDGAIAPGTVGATPDYAHLTVNGAVTLNIGGRVDLEITKSIAGTNSDVLALDSGSTLTFGGNLNVFADGLPLVLNDTFDLFDAGSFAGSFFTQNLPALDDGLFWDTSKLSVDGTIMVVPEPTGCALLLGGLSLLAARRRRRS